MHNTGIDRAKWDLSLATGHRAEAYVFELLTGVNAGHVEVKRDAQARNTGNLYVEFQQKKQGEWCASGLATTEADAWAFVLPPSDVVLVTPTDHLRAVARDAYRAGRIVLTMHDGDIPTRGVLVRLSDLLPWRNGGAA